MLLLFLICVFNILFIIDEVEKIFKDHGFFFHRTLQTELLKVVAKIRSHEHMQNKLGNEFVESSNTEVNTSTEKKN